MGPKEITLLVDVGVGKKVEAWLSREGYKAKTIRDLDPRMLDVDILNSYVTGASIHVNKYKNTCTELLGRSKRGRMRLERFFSWVVDRLASLIYI